MKWLQYAIILMDLAEKVKSFFIKKRTVKKVKTRFKKLK
jgi:hypothetical protein